MRPANAIASVVLISLAACGQSSDQTTTTASMATQEQQFPDVIAVEVTEEAGGTFRFDVTLSSPYDSNERYADAWRVISIDGDVYGNRVLTHPHANEQPFTRSLAGVEIPEGVEKVVVEGRDLVNGWGGKTLKVSLP